MKRLILLLSVVTVFLLTFLPNLDTDFGWHYRCGKLLLQRQGSCTTNRFSYFLGDYRANNPSFIYDAVTAFTYDRFGFTGLSVINALVFSAVFLLLTTILAPIGAEIILAGLAIILFLSSGVLDLGLRSQLFSYLFFVVFLLIIDRLEQIPRLVWWLPVIMVVWVNTHIGFVLGPVLVGGYCLEAVGQRRRVKLIATAAAVTAGATLINPFGWRVYLALFDHLTAPLQTMIAEWTAPPLLQIVLLVGLTGVLIYYWVKRHSLSLYRLIVLLILFIIALQARRNLPLYYTFFFYCLLSLPVIRQILVRSRLLTRLRPLSLALLLIIGLWLLIVRVPATYRFDTIPADYCRLGLRPLPCEAVQRYPALKGNIFTMYEWGGYLIWKKPNSRVFVDGRMPAWKDTRGRSPYQVFLDIIQTKPGWNEVLRQTRTDYLLIENGSFLDLLLRPNPHQFGWEEQYRDAVAVIYRRSNR
ncbi:hypothetical protein M1523_03170 [Patescibacteria group bacterium]|nr:hypothetical protein [Patescibacteria group bacterium]MCL5091278.1 hypothetical protein [Patescibacteria group bacterium]